MTPTEPAAAHSTPDSPPKPSLWARFKGLFCRAPEPAPPQTKAPPTVGEQLIYAVQTEAWQLTTNGFGHNKAGELTRGPISIRLFPKDLYAATAEPWYVHIVRVGAKDVTNALTSAEKDVLSKTICKRIKETDEALSREQKKAAEAVLVEALR